MNSKYKHVRLGKSKMSSPLDTRDIIAELVITKYGKLKLLRKLPLGDLIKEKNKPRHVITSAITTARISNGMVYCLDKNVDKLLKDKSNRYIRLGVRLMVYTEQGTISPYQLRYALHGSIKGNIYNMAELLGYKWQVEIKTAIRDTIINGNKLQLTTPNGHTVVRVTPFEVPMTLNGDDYITEKDIVDNPNWGKFDEYKVGYNGELSTFLTSIKPKYAMVTNPAIGKSEDSIEASSRTGKQTSGFLYTLCGHEPTPDKSVGKAKPIFAIYEKDGKLHRKCHPTLGITLRACANISDRPINKFEYLVNTRMIGDKRYDIFRFNDYYLKECIAFEIPTILTTTDRVSAIILSRDNL